MHTLLAIRIIYYDEVIMKYFYCNRILNRQVTIKNLSYQATFEKVM